MRILFKRISQLRSEFITQQLEVGDLDPEDEHYEDDDDPDADERQKGRWPSRPTTPAKSATLSPSPKAAVEKPADKKPADEKLADDGEPADDGKPADGGKPADDGKPAAPGAGQMVAAATPPQALRGPDRSGTETSLESGKEGPPLWTDDESAALVAQLSEDEKRELQETLSKIRELEIQGGILPLVELLDQQRCCDSGSLIKRVCDSLHDAFS